MSDVFKRLKDEIESDLTRVKREFNNSPLVEYEFGDGSGKRQLVRLPREEYESVALAEGGIPLTDVFPSGISVLFRGDEIVGVSPDPTEKMRELGLIR